MLPKNWKDHIGSGRDDIRIRCENRWDRVAKPLGSFGEFEKIISKIAAFTGDELYTIEKRALAVFCADNGVVCQGVTQTGSEITALVAKELAKGGTCVCHMARKANVDVLPVDVGINQKIEIQGVLQRKVNFGTGDISCGPAMTREEAQEAVEVGFFLAMELKEKGYKILAAGEMGIGNTTSTSAVTAVLLDRKPLEVTGKGAGLSAKDVQKKISVIERAIQINHPDRSDPLDIISKVGGFDIAAMAGFYCGAAYAHVPVVLDGVISAAAALCAVRICPEVIHALIPSHISAEPASKFLLSELGLTPIIHGGMHMGEGTGAVALFPLLDMAYDVYITMSTFDEFHMDRYKKLDG